jgi:hypothetical protein
MVCELLIRATDGSNGFKKGYIVVVKDQPCVWGAKETLPDFIRLIISDCTAAQVNHFRNSWDIKYKFTLVAENDAGYRYKVEIDPAYISASDTGRHEIKDSMTDWAVDRGFAVVGFTSDSMTVDILKPADLPAIKADFADVFDTVLSIRRYYFSAADVDMVIAAGGVYTLTKQQALNNVVDKLDE